MTSICLTCKTTTYWRNQRGNKMDKVCRHCGGKVVKAAFIYGAWRQFVPKPAPKRYTTSCCLCGTRGMVPGRMRALVTAETFRVAKTAFGGALRFLAASDPENVPLQPGAVVCRNHESFEDRARDNSPNPPYPVYVKINC